jgi:hypothetical protein
MPGETDAVMGRTSSYVFTDQKLDIRILVLLRGVGKTRPAPVRGGTGALLEEIAAASPSATRSPWPRRCWHPTAA